MRRVSDKPNQYRDHHINENNEGGRGWGSTDLRSAKWGGAVSVKSTHFSKPMWMVRHVRAHKRAGAAVTYFRAVRIIAGERCTDVLWHHVKAPVSPLGMEAVSEQRESWEPDDIGKSLTRCSISNINVLNAVYKLCYAYAVALLCFLCLSTVSKLVN